MGMSADILAIGPYSPDIALHLGYPPELYCSTRRGALVLATLFGISEGSSASRDFAACLGITDTWDFNQHQIDSRKIDFDRLRSVLSGLGSGDEYNEDLDALIALRKHGFQFLFRPNG